MGARAPGHARNQRPFVYIPPELRLSSAAFCALSVILPQQTAVIDLDLNSINWFVFTEDKKRVTCGVASESCDRM